MSKKTELTRKNGGQRMLRSILKELPGRMFTLTQSGFDDQNQRTVNPGYYTSTDKNSLYFYKVINRGDDSRRDDRTGVLIRKESCPLILMGLSYIIKDHVPERPPSKWAPPETPTRAAYVYFSVELQFLTTDCQNIYTELNFSRSYSNLDKKKTPIHLNDEYIVELGRKSGAIKLTDALKRLACDLEISPEDAVYVRRQLV